MERLMRIVSENGVVIFSKSSCCMCYAVCVLFQELGVDPVVFAVDQDPDEQEIELSLVRLGCSPTMPAVFIAGDLVGSTNEVMSHHLSGALAPLLRPYQAGRLRS